MCPGINKVVPSNGPTPCDVMLILEAPGKEENQKGIPLVGKTGREVNEHYLPLAGLRRDRVYCANTISCLPPKDGKLDMKKPHDKALAECCAQHHLYKEIKACNPKIIVMMGGVANSLVPSNIYLDYDHGMVRKWDVPGDKERNIFVQYHPSVALYEPKKMLHIRTDWIRLKRYLAGTLNIAVDEYEGLEDYRALESVNDVHETLYGKFNRPLACDTENRKDRSPFCLTYSVESGTGYLIRSEQVELLDTFQQYIDTWAAPFLWHNWLHDFEITSAMNLRFPHKKIVDTMLLAFELGNIPKGLKALAYRELGINMSDFEDVVKPYSHQLCLNYFRHATCEEWPKPEERLEKQKDGKYKIKKPHGFNQKLKRFFTDYDKSEGEKDVFKMWNDNWDAEHEMVESALGPFPGMCISHVPFDKVIRYAAQDADGLGRLYPILKHMVSQVRRTTQEKWRDAA